MSKELLCKPASSVLVAQYVWSPDALKRHYQQNFLWFFLTVRLVTTGTIADK